MINLHVTYLCKTKENRDKLYNSIKDLGAICRTEKGNHGYDYFFPAEIDDQLFLWERWEDQASLDAHGAADHMKKIGAIKKELDIVTQFDRVEG